jgi:hypothetical protein
VRRGSIERPAGRVNAVAPLGRKSGRPASRRTSPKTFSGLVEQDGPANIYYLRRFFLATFFFAFFFFAMSRLLS